MPFVVMRKLNMIKYWIKVLKQDNRSVTRMVYEMLRSDEENNVNYYKKLGIPCKVHTRKSRFTIYMVRPRFY